MSILYSGNHAQTAAAERNRKEKNQRGRAETNIVQIGLEKNNARRLPHETELVEGRSHIRVQKRKRLRLLRRYGCVGKGSLQKTDGERTMMFINIVTVHSGWILQKIAERVMATGNLLFEDARFFLSHAPIDQKDVINFYIDVYNCYHGKTKGIDVGYVTHLGYGIEFQEHWKTLDFVVHKAKRYYEEWAKYYPKEKMAVLRPGLEIEKFPLKKITIGIFQRGKFAGKGFFFMKELANHYDFENFRFIFCGKDWDGVVELYKSKGIEVEYYTSENYENYPKLYAKCDYVLIPSLVEAGPYACVEALAQGIPVIASDVGWCNEFDVILYEPGNVSQLIEILKRIEKERLERRKQVENMTFENYVKSLYEIFKNLSGNYEKRI